MLTNYVELIKTKYPDARTWDEEGHNFSVEWRPDPALDQLPYVDQETGEVVNPDNSGVPLVPIITFWTLPEQQPTIAELDAYAASPEYAAILAQREVDRQANEAETTLVETVLADIATELDWLDQTITGYDAMTTAQKLAAFKRVMQEMRGTLRAVRWLGKRLNS